MGAVGGMLGLSGGAGGTGFSGPQAAEVTSPVTQADIDAARLGTTNALGAQQGLLAALQGQGGLGAQTQNYQQLQDVIAGRGPNPAQTMLSQATGQNVANQAALMAGQRGAGANVGLLARQAAQQGAQTQQQAAGQGATMQAQQALSALGQAGQMATQMAGQQIGQTNANTAAQQAQQQAQYNSIAGVNQANVGMQSNINAANSAMANTRMGNQGDVVGGIMNAAGMGSKLMSGGGGAAGMAAAGARGGQVVKMADGGMGGPQSSIGQFLVSNQAPQLSASDPAGISMAGLASDKAITNASKQQPKEKPPETKGSPGELPGAGLATEDNPPVGTYQTQAVEGGDYENQAAGGGKVVAKTPAQRPEVKGNSYRNDKVPAVLSVGEIVIPRDVLQSKDPVKASAEFVAKTLGERKAKGGMVQGFQDGGEAIKKEEFTPSEDTADKDIQKEISDAADFGNQAQQADTSQLSQPLGQTQPTQPAEYEKPSSGDQFKTTDFQAPENVVKAINAESPEQVRMRMFNDAKARHSDEETQQAKKWENDIYNGHIEPKTYQKLFADQGTLGRIGTLFGLMVSGAGGGLSHQPNAVMGMMNQEIMNDLEAQKQSKLNGQNFLRINQADLANKVHSIEGLEQAKTAAQTRSLVQMKQASFHTLLEWAKKQPPATQARVQAMLTNMGPDYLKDISNTIDMGAQAMAMDDINPFKQGALPSTDQPASVALPPGAASQGADQTQPTTEVRQAPNQQPAIVPAQSQKSAQNQQTNKQSEVEPESAVEPLLAPNAEHIAKLASKKELLKPHAAEISAQLGDARKAETAMKNIHGLFQRLSENADKAGASGYLMRKFTNLSGVPYVGPMAEGAGAMIGDVGSHYAQNRAYNADQGALAAQIKAALPSAGEGLIHEILGPNLPEEDDPYDLRVSKEKNIMDKIKANLKLDKLEMAHALYKKKSKK